MNKLIIVILVIITISSCATVQNDYSFDNALENGIQKIINDLPANADIAILNFKSDNTNLSSYIIEEIYDKLINGGKFSIMERSRTDAIFDEVGYQLSAEVDDNEIINIGHQLGADFVVTGQIIFSGQSYRLRISAIDIAKGRRVASSALNIKSNDKQVAFLLNQNNSQNLILNNSIIGTAWTVSLEGARFDDYAKYYFYFDINNIVRSNIIDGYKNGTWSQTNNEVMISFNEIDMGVFLEFKFTLIDDKTMRGTTDDGVIFELHKNQ
jgi:TolB-like protein